MVGRAANGKQTANERKATMKAKKHNKYLFIYTNQEDCNRSLPSGTRISNLLTANDRRIDLIEEPTFHWLLAVIDHEGRRLVNADGEDLNALMTSVLIKPLGALTNDDALRVGYDNLVQLIWDIYSPNRGLNSLVYIITAEVV